MKSHQKSFSTLFLFLFALAIIRAKLDCISLKAFNQIYKYELRDKNVKDFLTDKNKIGEGGMGAVFKVPWTEMHNSKLVEKFIAIKMGKKEDSIYAIKKEIALLKMLNENNLKHVIKYYECFFEDDNYFIVMEYVPYSFATEDPKNPFLIPEFYEQFLALSPRKRLGIYLQIAEGLAELHKLNIVHHDIKPENIAYDPNAEYPVKILDFGVAKNQIRGIGGGTKEFLDLDKSQYFYLNRGDPMAKALYNRSDQMKGDIWALGITIYELENNEDGCVFDFREDFEQDSIVSNIKIIREIVTDERWFAKRGIDVCTKNKQVCFYDVMNIMMEIDRKDRDITAEEIAIAFAQILGRLPESEVWPEESTGFIGGMYKFLSKAFGPRQKKIQRQLI